MQIESVEQNVVYVRHKTYFYHFLLILTLASILWIFFMCPVNAVLVANFLKHSEHSRFLNFEWMHLTCLERAAKVPKDFRHSSQWWSRFLSWTVSMWVSREFFWVKSFWQMSHSKRRTFWWTVCVKQTNKQINLLKFVSKIVEIKEAIYHEVTKRGVQLSEFQWSERSPKLNTLKTKAQRTKSQT